MTKKTWENTLFIVALILLMILFLKGFFKLSLKNRKETERRKNEFKELHHEQKSLEEKLRKHQYKFDKIQNRIRSAYFILRILIVLLAVGIFFSAKLIWNNPTLPQFMAWFALVCTIVLGLVFLKWGFKNFAELIESVESWVQIKVYKDDIDILEKIDASKSRVSEISKRKQELEEEDDHANLD